MMVARAYYTRRRRGRRHAASTRENRSRSATRPPMPPNRTSSYASWPVEHRRAQDCGLAPQRSRERACRRRRACASVGCEGGCGRRHSGGWHGNRWHALERGKGIPDYWKSSGSNVEASRRRSLRTSPADAARWAGNRQCEQQDPRTECGTKATRRAGKCARGPWTNMSTALPLGRAGGECALGRRQREHLRRC